MILHDPSQGGKRFALLAPLLRNVEFRMTCSDDREDRAVIENLVRLLQDAVAAGCFLDIEQLFVVNISVNVLLYTSPASSMIRSYLCLTINISRSTIGIT